MPTKFENFDIEITSNEPFKFFGSVLDSPGGSCKPCPVKFAFANDAKDVEIQRLKLEKALFGSAEFRGPGSMSEKIIREFGIGLFRGIFREPEAIKKIYSLSKELVSDSDEDTGLRIKLRIRAPELTSLPWEYLWDDSEIPPYVSLSLPVVRHFESAGLNKPMKVKLPLRILGMIANPTTPEWPRLDEPAERRRINEAIGPLQQEGRIHFEWVSGGTATDLMTKLMEGEWHIFHFIGHGGHEESSSALGEDDDGYGEDDSGYIVLLDEYGQPKKQFSTDLAALLVAKRRSLRLAVLNCCDSATVGMGSRTISPAAALMRSGMPAVVAMQFPISDKAAVSLAEGFYKALSNNQPVDQAVTSARGFIRESSGLEWGIPVLYMRSTDGQLFELSDLDAAEQAHARNRAVAGVTSARSTQDHQPEKQQVLETDERFREFMRRSDLRDASDEELERLSVLGRELLGSWSDKRLSQRLAAIYCEVGARQQHRSDIAKAIASFGYAIELDPGQALYWTRRANLNVRMGAFERSLSDIANAIKLEPRNAENHWMKGIVLSMAAGPDNNPGRIDEAIHAFETAMSLNPQQAKYRLSRANLLMRVNRYVEAFTDFDFASSLDPEIPILPVREHH